MPPRQGTQVLLVKTHGIVLSAARVPRQAPALCCCGGGRADWKDIPPYYAKSCRLTEASLREWRKAMDAAVYCTSGLSAYFRHRTLRGRRPGSVTILGSTGSIGCNTIDLISPATRRRVRRCEALTAQRSVERLAEQARAISAPGQRRHRRSMRSMAPSRRRSPGSGIDGRSRRRATPWSRPPMRPRIS